VVFGCWVCYCVLTGIACVCMVGVIIYLVLFAYIISGFTPFYERMNFYCYLIFVYIAIYRCSISSADSFSSAITIKSGGLNVGGGVHGSLPLVVAGDCVAILVCATT
jgi:hypothetical protein